MNSKSESAGELPAGFWRAIDRLQSAGGVAAVLAVGITATLCLGYLLPGDRTIPPVLEHGFTVILGFYFGTKTQRKAQRAEEPQQ